LASPLQRKPARWKYWWSQGPGNLDARTVLAGTAIRGERLGYKNLDRPWSPFAAASSLKVLNYAISALLS